MLRVAIFAVGGIAASWLVGCASTSADSTAALLTPAATSSSPTAAQGYGLSSSEQALDCKQLTGRMQIRILEIRDYNERNNTSMVSRALQVGSTAVIGGSKAGLDPEGRNAKDRALLEAYNQQLATKGCKTYDLDAELKPKDFRVTPNATVAPPGKAK